MTFLDTDKTLVGEGSIWDVAEQALYFIDIFGKKLLRYEPTQSDTQAWSTPRKIGSFALRLNGGAIVAIEDGVYDLNLTSGELTLRAVPGTLHPEVIFNDGKTDRRGRFFVGTGDVGSLDANLEVRGCLSAIYRLDGDALVTVDTGIALGNGPCWSPDDRTFYYADTSRHLIYAYDYDIDSATLSNRRHFATTSSLGGLPDGATTDSDGNVWSALALGGAIVCFSPDGEVKRKIPVPVAMPTSVAFGGPDLDRLYVTTADTAALFGRDDDPNGGKTFVIDGLNVRGIAETRCTG
jgi:L-arabinonolactonase